MDDQTLWDIAAEAKRQTAQAVASFKAQMAQAEQTLASLPPIPDVSTWTMSLYKDANFMAACAARTELMDLKDYHRDAATAWARFETYEPMKGLTAHCPHCWIGEGRTAILSPRLDGQTSFLKCLECGANYPADIRAGDKPPAALH